MVRSGMVWFCRYDKAGIGRLGTVRFCRIGRSGGVWCAGARHGKAWYGFAG